MPIRLGTRFRGKRKVNVVYTRQEVDKIVRTLKAELREEFSEDKNVQKNKKVK